MNSNEISDDEQSNSCDGDYNDVYNDVDEYYSKHNKNTLEEPMDSEKEYVYHGLSSLIMGNIELFADDYSEVTVNICTYQINTNGEKPFLQFVLRKYSSTHNDTPDLLTFPSFKRRPGESVLESCDMLEQVICTTYGVNSCNCEYKGFINDRSNFYVFYELKENSINVHDLYRKSDLWLVLTDEIINHNSSCEFPIDNDVSNFFMYYINFACLKDLQDNYIETPIVAYSGVENKQINMISCFGVPPTLEDCLPNNHFYFTSYKNAIDQSKQLNNSDSKVVIIRFSLFAGRMKTILNDSTNFNIETENYDSVYIGNSSKSPLWALKKYEQQTSLTCHFI
jgi:hypothetical protein